MKNIALAGLFAALAAHGLAGQTENGSEGAAKARQAPLQVSAAVKMELAAVMAVEEQEKDYKKAVTLYESVLENGKLSKEAHGYAAYRLASLLRRLGRADEAKKVLRKAGKGLVVSLDDVTNEGQDPERQKQLRLQARQILKQLFVSRYNYANNAGTGRSDWYEQLRWIGAPATPEIIAVLQTDLTDEGDLVRVGVAQQLYSWLWQHGGAQSAKHLAQVANTAHGEVAQKAAKSRQEFDLDSIEVRAYLELDDVGRVVRFFDTIADSLSVDELLRVAAGGHTSLRARVLIRLARRDLAAAQLQRALAFCVEGRKGPDPELGKAAELFVTSTEAQQSIEGLAMLVSILPDLHKRNVMPGSYQKVPRGAAVAYNNYKARRFSDAEVAQLLPPMRAAIRRIGPVKKRQGPAGWIVSMATVFMASGSEEAVRLGIEMWDLGYPMHHAFSGYATPGTAVELLKRWGKMPRQDRKRFWWAFDKNDMTPEAFPLLCELAGKPTIGKEVESVLRLIGQTGHPDAADWLAAEWRKGAVEGNPKRDNEYYVNALLTIGRTDKSERVRIAMRNMVRGFGGPRLTGKQRARLMLALMSMADARALDFITVGLYAGEASHPYADKDRRYEQKPLHYLASTHAHPAHGYTAAQITDTFKRLLAYEKRQPITTRSVYPGTVRDDVMVILAEGEPYSRNDNDWQRALVTRLNERLKAGKDVGELAPCFLRGLQNEVLAPRFLSAASDETVKRYQDQIRQVLDGDDGPSADYAMDRLVRAAVSVDAVGLLQNKHDRVRSRALSLISAGAQKVEPAKVIPLLRDPSANVRLAAVQYVGAIVEKSAVPALIELLRDSDYNVRKQAADALTSIRFYHEQQAHWDRVLKGLDASPASAAEKLLVQAKPDAAKEQRLMAIKSLGVLGVPEALPFLIEWTGDKDKEIRAAARAAITEIHLKPRK